MAKDRESFGDRVRAARVAMNMSQAQLAKAISVTSQAISYWENDRNKPEADTLSLLANELCVTATYLLTGGQTQDSIDTIEMIKRGQGRVVPVFQATEVVRGAPVASTTVQTHWMCGHNSYVVPLWDESNAPEYIAGDHVVLDPDVTPVPGDMVLASKSGTLPIFGRYSRRLINGNQVKIVEFLNAPWGAQAIEPSSGDSIVAVMVEHARQRGRKATP